MITIYKRLGETPLQALNRFRQERPEYTHEILSYAGRLDPMAEGLLLVLVGEENKKREAYLGLDKEYEVTALLGFETDTYDVLGKIINTEVKPSYLQRFNLRDVIEPILTKLEGTYDQAYPPFSSKPVHGKPLFQWAREGKIGEIEIPKQSITVSKIVVTKLNKISAHDVHEEIYKKIKLVEGDFRQQEILDLWDTALEKKEEHYTLVTFTVACSSGAYVRGIVHDFGKNLKTGATVFHLKRTKIADFSLENVDLN